MRHVEPPSPILTAQNTADSISEDPLADRIYMILDMVPGDEPGRYLVYTGQVRTGLSYIGMTGETIS